MDARPSPARVVPGVESRPSSPTGEFVELAGEPYYRIRAFHRLEPFLITVPGDTDLWMFVASGGGLTAGRVDADGSLFPYRTVDELHDAHHHTGPQTLIRVERGMGEVLWEPFLGTESPAIERNLYKNVPGSRLVFEEVHHELDLVFRYRWSGCDEFGWVRSSTLLNRGQAPVRVALLDGLRNVLPYGAPLALYQQASNLVDAYKRTEVDAVTGLGIFSLTAGITDRPEAIEVLRANTVWCCGLERFRVHLSPSAVEAFRSGKVVPEDDVLKGERGSYLVRCSLELEPGAVCRWHIVGDAGQDHVQIAALRRRLLEEKDLEDRIEESLGRAQENLRRNVASADGLQRTARPESWSHHFANVLFNVMRGGVFLHNDEAPVADLADFLRVRNRAVAERQRSVLAAWPVWTTMEEIRDAARASGDVDFQRLGYEYLPLHFGRRHGDPSRPWNRFSIRVRNRDGERTLCYQGNWRDLFQNWEALATAFPRALPNMVARFVNASTVDGFNPYRITRDGVEWETVSPEDPWGNIGYWGDHQIIYLLKLLEGLDRHDPHAFDELLGREIFSYAEVPYRIKPYEDVLRDPRSTIDFDAELAARIEDRVRREGTDGKLLRDQDGSVYHANLLEKLLVTGLSKLSNLVPGAGIWMNTQRPEWNDANNALAGGGVSVVTLCYLRRYLVFLLGRLADRSEASLPVSREVADWFLRVHRALEQGPTSLPADGDGPGRKRMMDALGGAFSAYREAVYGGGLSGKTDLAVGRVVDLFRVALGHVDRGIAANRRPDGLFHSYNLLAIADDASHVDVTPLPEMLEGQVAVLSCGFLDPQESVDLLERLFDSALYRPDPRSFLLYPERELPGFLARNVVPESRVETIPLMRDLLAAGDTSLVARDADGICRFHGDLGKAADVARVLQEREGQPEWTEAVARDRDAVLDLFEDVFDHASYTGRSGVMYAYEGLGCIYWHMVAKLLLAVQETFWRAEDGAPGRVREDLARVYFRIRSGMGYEKSVEEFGAFPTDPYSHTPATGGAKQPGMTGQVKEEILTRWGELGVRVEGGTVAFRPRLLRSDELLAEPVEFEYFDVDGTPRTISLPPGSLAFTFCQVPVIYERLEGGPCLHVAFADGSSTEHSGTTLDAGLSAELFSRSGRIDRIRVGIPGRELCRL